MSSNPESIEPYVQEWNRVSFVKLRESLGSKWTDIAELLSCGTAFLIRLRSNGVLSDGDYKNIIHSEAKECLCLEIVFKKAGCYGTFLSFLKDTRQSGVLQKLGEIGAIPEEWAEEYNLPNYETNLANLCQQNRLLPLPPTQNLGHQKGNEINTSSNSKSDSTPLHGEFIATTDIPIELEREPLLIRTKSINPAVDNAHTIQQLRCPRRGHSTGNSPNDIAANLLQSEFSKDENTSQSSNHHSVANTSPPLAQEVCSTNSEWKIAFSVTLLFGFAICYSSFDNNKLSRKSLETVTGFLRSFPSYEDLLSNKNSVREPYDKGEINQTQQLTNTMLQTTTPDILNGPSNKLGIESSNTTWTTTRGTAKIFVTPNNSEPVTSSSNLLTPVSQSNITDLNHETPLPEGSTEKWNKETHTRPPDPPLDKANILSSIPPLLKLLGSLEHSEISGNTSTTDLNNLKSSQTIASTEPASTTQGVPFQCDTISAVTVSHHTYSILSAHDLQKLNPSEVNRNNTLVIDPTILAKSTIIPDILRCSEFYENLVLVGKPRLYELHAISSRFRMVRNLTFDISNMCWVNEGTDWMLMDLERISLKFLTQLNIYGVPKGGTGCKEGLEYILGILSYRHFDTF